MSRANFFLEREQRDWFRNRLVQARQRKIIASFNKEVLIDANEVKIVERIDRRTYIDWILFPPFDKSLQLGIFFTILYSYTVLIKILENITFATRVSAKRRSKWSQSESWMVDTLKGFFTRS